MDSERLPKAFQCSFCPTTFRFNKNLNQHLRKKHQIEPPIQPGKIICPLSCQEKQRTMKELREHLESFHGQAIEREEHDFADSEAFETWKKRLETTTGYAYIRRISEKVRKGEAKTHFICHRSGVFKSESTGRRKLKKNGSNKIGAICPATMETSRLLSDGKVHVVFWKTHVGHEADIFRTPTIKNFRPKNSDAIKYEVCAVLPAAGIGERMGLDVPKQYIPIHGRPIICYTVEAFLRIPFIKKVVVVAAAESLELMLRTLTQMCALKDEKLMVTEGVGSRHQSIDAGLKALQLCETQPEVVVIHDGVRPFVSEKTVCNVVLAAKEHGAAGVVCPLVSTVVSVDENGFLDTSLDRGKYRASEMPQAFQFDILCKAYNECSAYDLEYGTECLHLAEKYCNVKAKLFPGTSNLWKVTHPKDIYTATACVKENQDVAIANHSLLTDFVPILQLSLNKKFKNPVHMIGKVNEGFLCRFQNIVHFWKEKKIRDVIEQLIILYASYKSFQSVSMVNIIFGDSSDEKQFNFVEVHKQAANVAKEFKQFNFLFYFILFQKRDSVTSMEEVADMSTSLLFDSNPHISGSIFIR